MGNSSNLEQWAGRERLGFVERCAYWRGFVNRGDVTEVFGVSAAQASADLMKYQEINPGALVYQTSRKRYEGAEMMRCVLQEPSLEEAMQLFLGETVPWFNRSRLPMSGERVAVVQLPMRRATPIVERAVFQSVLHGLRLELKYLSMTDGPQKSGFRWIRPHAFAFDGYRWHARSWCERNEDFRDFVLSRMLEIRWPTEVVTLPQVDDAWEQKKTLRLKPNASLAEPQRLAIEADYAMEQGETSVVLREAMTEYTYAHLRLPLPDGNPRPVQLEISDGVPARAKSRRGKQS
jgi:hypothetical protein